LQNILPNFIASHLAIMKNKNSRYFALTFAFLIILTLIFSFRPANKISWHQAATAKCLIISDMHFNPLYGSSESDTVLKKKLENSTFDEWKTYFESSKAEMTLDSTLFFKDANYAVLQSAFFNMKKRLPDPAFILIAGDFIWHGATPADSLLKKRCIQFITRLFKENFPKALIIPAMGNNDTYGTDYALQNTKFLKDFAKAWEPNLPTQPADSLIKHGYYKVETGNLKVIVLNSASVDSAYTYPETAGKMLKWLHGELANTNGKNIWILMHIPPGLNGFSIKAPFWKSTYTNEFVNDIVKFAPEVRFMIASHTHLNDFKVVYDGSKKPVAFMRIVPSICDNHGNNPSFEIAEFNSATDQVISETNWYLNLKTVSKGKDPLTEPWIDTLSLPSSLKMADISAGSFSKFIDNVKNDKTGQSLRDYAWFYNVGTKIPGSINSTNYLNYLKADSLQAK
jgi:sphingomyelin phosphodiesterase acid-like 3